MHQKLYVRWLLFTSLKTVYMTYLLCTESNQSTLKTNFTAAQFSDIPQSSRPVDTHRVKFSQNKSINHSQLISALFNANHYILHSTTHASYNRCLQPQDKISFTRNQTDLPFPASSVPEMQLYHVIIIYTTSPNLFIKDSDQSCGKRLNPQL